MSRRDIEDKIIERAITRGAQRAAQENEEAEANVKRGQQTQKDVEQGQAQHNLDQIEVKECSVVMNRLDQTLDPLQFARSQWNAKGTGRY